MRVFISYSFNDRELYILSLLAFRLQEEGHTVLASSGVYGSGSSQQQVVEAQIRSASLFIGIITSTSGSDHADRVHQEWVYARNARVPSLLLIEGDRFQWAGPNIIRFNRNDPNDAVNYILQQQKQMQAQFNTPQTNGNNALAWILGGAAAILAIKLLTSDE